ncbi:TauD/TfdA family dioxygenase [Rhodococcus tukisamuensis]|uniref:Taurine catabolism dioxygenase TauD, TfdA family n=1 Tax=Rhodococcus tukisamuensis TaxID=168276 RepID=A0A1G6T666_9NOCA|nr:TauD/TfdA family dioxygenase [Rhodococcus tukisamuensis]SDD24558.1 Taurine catabolism dioxygenase TauD, TfdA family [Rhodococcus tukisamuensis]
MYGQLGICASSPGALQQRPAWRASDIAGSTGWRLRLTSSDVAEVDSALNHSRSCGLPVLKLRAEHFPLPHLAARLHQLATDLDDGYGFGVIRGLPTERYSESDLRTILWGIGQHLGIAVSQDAYGHMVDRVRPTTAGTAQLTSDGSDITAVLGLQSGGQSVVVSSTEVFNEILAGWPKLAERMFGTYYLDRRGEHLPEELPYRAAPLACWFDGKLSIRYSRQDTVSAQRFSDIPKLEPEDFELFDLIDQRLDSARLRFEVEIRPGDIHLFNNYAVLHAQTRRGPHDRTATDLFRLWLTLRDGRALPPNFIWPDGRGGRGGVTPRDVVMPSHIGRPLRPGQSTVQS